MSSLPVLSPHRPEAPGRLARAREELGGWRLVDLLAYGAAWAAGLMLTFIALALLAFLAIKGVSFLSLDLITSRPEPGIDQSKTGGILDPIIGTFVMITIGIAVATPLGVGSALWVVEYGKPTWLARAVESAIEVVAGMPSIVIAIFGLALVQEHLFAWFSFTGEGGAVYGRSFVNAGVAMSLIALPLVFGATREALLTVPSHMREASYALGKTQAETIRRVLLPSVRSNIGTGMALGMGRIAGDTAIVVILLGASLRLQPLESADPVTNFFRGTGSTLTSFVYNNSPAGEGNAPDKAYAAGFFLLLIVILLNFAVSAVLKRGEDGPAK
ncbi:MAG: ABC transporter permease subunit [Solirubrobacteraceae bacterium]|nr:ABC transporter permease subunit [Solirubrobacteraceae bacterium]